MSDADDVGPEAARLREIFRRRAAALAVPAEDGARARLSDVFVLTAGTLRFALPITNVRSVVRPRQVGAIPCTAAGLGAVVHLDGGIVSLVDLGELAQGVASTARDRGALRAVLMEADGRRLALLTTEVEGLVALPTAELERAEAAAAIAPPWLRGPVSDGLYVVDPPMLLTWLRARQEPDQSLDRGAAL